MKLRVDIDWSIYKAGQVVEVDDATGHLMIGTGVASVVEIKSLAETVNSAVDSMKPTGRKGK